MRSPRSVADTTTSSSTCTRRTARSTARSSTGPDKILVPVTPDVPALRAAVQLRDVATELRIRDRLAMIVNRANSGVSVADMERTVGMPAMAQIRSGGLLFVRAANAGRTVIEMYPRERITEDFDALADRVLRRAAQGPAQAAPALQGSGFRLVSHARPQAHARAH